jgi:hypothetical protein
MYTVIFPTPTIVWFSRPCIREISTKIHPQKGWLRAKDLSQRLGNPVERSEGSQDRYQVWIMKKMDGAPTLLTTSYSHLHMNTSSPTPNSQKPYQPNPLSKQFVRHPFLREGMNILTLLSLRIAV